MKLHLPKGLRKAVMACMAAIATLSTTVGTGIVTGGAITYMLATPQASADSTWNGGLGDKTVADWATESNWILDGGTKWTNPGPGTTGSNMWDPIHLTGDGTAESLVIGAEDSRVEFEGWNPRFDLNNGAKLYAHFRKFQCNENGQWIKLNNNSSLDAIVGGLGDGNEGGSLTVDVGSGSDFTLRLAKQLGGNGLYINLNSPTATAAIVSSNGTQYTLPNAVVVKTSVADIEVGTWASQTLGFKSSGVTFNNLTLDLGFSSDWVQSDTEITEENYKEYANQYYIGINEDGYYTVTYSKLDPNAVCVWQGGNLEWVEGSVFANDNVFDSGDFVTFDTADATVVLKEDISSGKITIASGVTVTLTGGGYLLTASGAVTLEGSLVLKDSALADTVKITSGVAGSLTIDGDVEMGSSLSQYNGGLSIADGGILTVDTLPKDTVITSATDNAKLVIGGDYQVSQQLSGYTGDLVVADGALVYVGNSKDSNGSDTASVNAKRIIVQDGGTIYTHCGDTIAADWDIMSGAVVGNKDGHITYSGNIRFNILDPDAATAQYNADGTVSFKQFWQKTITLSGILSGDGTVQFTTPEWEQNAVYKLTHADNPFAGSYELRDGNSPTQDRNGYTVYKTLTIELAHATAAANATIVLNNNQTGGILKLNQDSTIKSISASQVGNKISAGSAAVLTVTDGSEGFAGTVDANVTVQFTGGDINIGAANNNGTMTLSGGTAEVGALVNNGTINLTGGAVAIGATLTNNGTIKIDGATISIIDPALLEAKGTPTAAGWSVDGTDGFETYESQSYYLVKGTGTVTGLAPEMGDFTLSLDTDGSVLLTADVSYGTVYHANTKSFKLEAADAARATGYVVADGLTVEANNTGETIHVDTVSIGADSTLTLAGNVALELAGGDLDNAGTFNFGGTTINSASGLNLKGNVNFTSEIDVIGARLNIAEDGILTLQDGAALNSSVAPSLHIKGTLAVAANATAVITATDDIHLSHEVENAKVVLNEGANLTISAKSFQSWKDSAHISLAEDSVLNVDSANFHIKGISMAADSTINVGEGSVLNLETAGDQSSMAAGSTINVGEGSVLNLVTAGNQSLDGIVNLDGGTIQSVNGGADNRQKSIAKLTGTGVILGSSWNLIWNVGDLSGNGDITWKNNGTHWAPSVLHINGGVYTGTLTADRITGKQGAHGAYQSVLQINAGAAETFAGAVINLNGQGADAYVQMALNTEQVSVGGLDGTQFSHIFVGVPETVGGGNNNSLVDEKGVSTSSSTLTITGDGEHTYAGSIASGISIVKSGTGSQTFSGDLSAFNGNITVTAGSLHIATVQSIGAGRALSLAAGTTLGAAVELNGGSLTLDATGTVASLGGHALSFGTEKTGLTLSLLDNVNSGSPITLLSGLAAGLDLAADATLGDYFTVDALNIVSSTGVMLLGEGESLRPDLTADRLLGSGLSVDGDKLVLTLLPAELTANPLYWETADGNGDWSGLSWSAQNADAPNPPAVDPGKMGIDFSAAEVATYEGEVVFNGDADATVQVDVTAKVKEMTIENGKYTFANDGGSLTVTDTMTIGENAEAVLNVGTEVKDLTLAGASSSLSTSADLEVSGKLTATNGGTITNTGAKSVELTAAELGSVSLLGSGGFELTDANFHGIITNTDTSIKLSGLQTIDKADLEAAGAISSSTNLYTDIQGVTPSDGSGNGYLSTAFIAKLFTDAAKVSGVADSTWQLSDNSALNVIQNADGTFSFATPSSGNDYYANSGTVDYRDTVFADTETQKTSALVLNGGSIKLSTNLAESAGKNFIRADVNGVVVLADGVTLNQSALSEEGKTITIWGSADSVYVLDEGGVQLHSNVTGFESAEDWEGTVKLGAVSGTSLDLTKLGNAKSAVTADSIDAQNLLVGQVGTLDVAGNVSLSSGDSSVNKMTVEGALSLGSAAKSSLTASDLTVKGAEGISLANGSSLTSNVMNVDGAIQLGADSTIKVIDTLTLGENASLEYTQLLTAPAVTVATLDADKLNLTIEPTLMQTVADAQTDKTQPIATLMEVVNGSDAAIDLNGYGTNVINPPGQKYGYTLAWDTTGKLLQLVASANENYMKEKYSQASPNARAGAALMDDVFAAGGIGAGADSDLKKILDAVDDNKSTEAGMASVAGSATAALGMAFSGDVERQLRAIRNRTTTMGVNQCVVNEGMPYFNAWVNAEGNMGELDQDGTMAGYTLDSWGGTIGFDVDVNPNLTLGLAITAMYGDFKVDGPDTLDGDLDTTYITAFARYSKRAWTHTFIATVGTMEGSYERTVNYGNGKYTTKGDTDGTGFGLMYEVGRTFALDRDGDAAAQLVANVAYRHTTVGGYTESGSDAALKVDDQTMDTVTLGVGGRVQAVVGENLFNRTSVLEARALAKFDMGDRSCEADVAFIGGKRSATVESAELGAFGVELGAGLSIPLGDEDSGTLFMDVSAELRSGYSNLNGTVGYRINF